MTGLLALVIGTLVAGNAFIAADRAVSTEMLGHDFLPFYAAGAMARTGQFHQLYDLEAIRQFEHQVAAANHLNIGENSIGPFWNPPFYAWIFAPLSALPYRTALGIWIAANLAALAAASVLMVRMLPPAAREDWRTWALVPLLVCLSMPFIQALSHGQNTSLSLLLLCCMVTAWRAQRDLLAGVLCGLMFYKPQLAALLAIMLVLNRGWRALIGVAFTAGSLVMLAAITMPDAVGLYLQQLPAMLQFMQVDNPYMWERHVTLAAMWRLLVQGHSAGEMTNIVTWLSALTAAAVGAGLLWIIWRDRRASGDDIFTGETKFIRRDRIIAASIVAMPLVMPFYFDYDLLLLGAAVVLLAGEVMMRTPGLAVERTDRLLIGTLIAFYAWTMINPIVAGLSGVNVSVVFLATAAALLIRRAGRSIEPEHFMFRRPQTIRVTARRAA